MFEGILVGLIVFVVGYTLAMRVMARRADVLHGEYIQSDDLNRNDVTRSWFAILQRYVDGVRLVARS